MKILALDIGDRWIGSAISDQLGIICKPYKTVQLDGLIEFLEKTIKIENIGTVVVGFPKTLSGRESEQTKKTIKIKELLEEKLSSVNNQAVEWVFCDERLSSKRAKTVLKKRGGSIAAEKQRQHSVAAAFILQNYLDRQNFA